MSVEIRVPQLPESVADATLVAWRRQVGETVSRDENLADLETDKVVLEVPAPVAGVLQSIRIAPGTTVKSGELLAVIEVGAVAAAASPAPVARAAPAAAVPAATVPAATVPATVAAATAAEPKLGPAAQRVAEELGLPKATIAAAAKGGRASKSDLVSAASAAPAAAKTAPLARAPMIAPVMPAARGARAERRVPMTRLHQKIAERLVQAQSTQALLTTFNEVDLTHVN
jgi:2-oxoglutarate dehydrogenase E2 component (dihydrolipoamide succinyltransferase)